MAYLDSDYVVSERLVLQYDFGEDYFYVLEAEVSIPVDAQDPAYDPAKFEEIRSALSAVLAEHDANRIKRVKLSQRH
jgi:hypothetical protein